MALVKRRIIQLISTLLCNLNLKGFATGRIYQGQLKTLCLPGLNCYSCPGAIGACPLGSLQSFVSGTVPRFPLYVAGWLLLMGLWLGRTVCGWLCPFGFIQELIYHTPLPKLGKSRTTRLLSRLKPVWGILLVLVIPLALWTVQGIGVPAFCKYLCPAGTLEASIPLLLLNAPLMKAAGWLTVWKFIVLAVFLLLMMVLYRPFCRFLCPLGAWYGCFNRHAALGITVDRNRCTACGHCAAICPMDIKIAGDQECISCGKCQHSCPSAAISFRQIHKNRKDEQPCQK